MYKEFELVQTFVRPDGGPIFGLTVWTSQSGFHYLGKSQKSTNELIQIKNQKLRLIIKIKNQKLRIEMSNILRPKFVEIFYNE
jgi:hypothetical protein